MVKLTNVDLTHLGGPMGTEYITDRWVKYFDNVKAAKAYAEKDYNNTRGPIQWSKKGRSYCTQDLGYVMYEIDPVKVTK